MKRFSVFLAVLALAGFAPLAQAAMQINYTITGYGPAPPCIGTDDSFVSCANTATPLLIQGLGGTSNSPGTASQSNETSFTGRIQNNDTVSHTITIEVIAPDFTMPHTPPDLVFDSYIGGTVFSARAGSSLTYRSCIDDANTLSGCPGTYQSALATPSVTSAGAYSSDQSGPISSLTTTYALDEELSITLAAGAALNWSASSSLTPVPEPMSIALLGGVVLLPSRLIRRKRSEVS